MNKYLKKWINETYPLMGNDIEELDHFDLQKFADWMEEQLAISRVVKPLNIEKTNPNFEEWLNKHKKIKNCYVWGNGYVMELSEMKAKHKELIELGI